MERVAATNIGLVRLAFNVGSRDTLALRARIFDTPTGHAFLASCPQHISRLAVFGNEVYGRATAKGSDAANIKEFCLNSDPVRDDHYYDLHTRSTLLRKYWA